MKCSHCGNDSLSSMSDDEGTAYWCVGKLSNGESCGFSEFVEDKKEYKKVAPTQFDYLRYRMGL